jgi:hypothetical protein
MANWRIRRFEVEDPEATPLTCLGGEHPVKVYVRDDDTGTEQVVEACVSDTAAACDAGGILYILKQAGYGPADWDTECGF